MAFIALGIPGLVVGVLVYLTVREPARGRLDGILDEIKPTLWQSLKFLWQQKAAFHVVIGGGLCALWGWGLIWWTTALFAARLPSERQPGGAM